MSDPQEEVRSQGSGKSPRGRRAGTPGDEAGLASQGGARSGAPGSGRRALPSPISSVFLSLGERRQETGCWEGELPREGEPPSWRACSRAPPGRKAPPGALEGTGDHGVLGALPTRRLLPGRRGGGSRSSIWSASLFRTAPQPAIPASFLLPGVRSGDGDWGLCLRGPRRWAPGLRQPPPSGSHGAGAETQEGEVTGGCGQREGTDSAWGDQGGLPGGSDS